MSSLLMHSCLVAGGLDLVYAGDGDDTIYGGTQFDGILHGEDGNVSDPHTFQLNKISISSAHAVISKLLEIAISL